MNNAKKYLVILKEVGEGCDYMIGCGMTTTVITAKNEEDLYKQVKKEFDQDLESIKYVELNQVKELNIEKLENQIGGI